MIEQEELLMLRALAEKQKAELAVKDKTIEGQINLFESTAELAKELFMEQKKITIASHGNSLGSEMKC